MAGPAPQGTAVVSVNPSAPVAGDTVILTVTGADAGAAVTISSAGQVLCTTTATETGTGTCEWIPTPGTYALTIDTAVGGSPQTIHRSVAVTDPSFAEPGGDDASGGSADALGSLGSMSTIFGSLG